MMLIRIKNSSTRDESAGIHVGDIFLADEFDSDKFILIRKFSGSSSPYKEESRSYYKTDAELIDIEKDPISTISCDKEDCNYCVEISDPIDPVEWLDKPCPDCGSNLLTEKDYIDSIRFSQEVKRLVALKEADPKAFAKLEASLMEKFKKVLPDLRDGDIVNVKHFNGTNINKL